MGNNLIVKVCCGFGSGIRLQMARASIVRRSEGSRRQTLGMRDTNYIEDLFAEWLTEKVDVQNKYKTP